LTISPCFGKLLRTLSLPDSLVKEQPETRYIPGKF